MSKYKNKLILFNLVILIIYFSNSVIMKENTLKESKLIYLKLIPVDPRSLMQGDFMALRYDISGELDIDSIPNRGYCVVILDSLNIAKRVRFQENTTPKEKNEYIIKYKVNSVKRLIIGAESYFFQEGTGAKYENAKYGGLKIDDEGNANLYGLYDENLNEL